MGDGSLLEAIGHVSDVLLLDIVKVLEAIKACFGANGCPLVQDPEPDPLETLIDNDVSVDYSCHVVVSYLVCKMIKLRVTVLVKVVCIETM